MWKNDSTKSGPNVIRNIHALHCSTQFNIAFPTQTLNCLFSVVPIDYWKRNIFPRRDNTVHVMLLHSFVCRNSFSILNQIWAYVSFDSVDRITFNVNSLRQKMTLNLVLLMWEHREKDEWDDTVWQFVHINTHTHAHSTHYAYIQSADVRLTFWSDYFSAGSFLFAFAA